MNTQLFWDYGKSSQGAREDLTLLHHITKINLGNATFKENGSISSYMVFPTNYKGLIRDSNHIDIKYKALNKSGQKNTVLLIAGNGVLKPHRIENSPYISHIQLKREEGYGDFVIFDDFLFDKLQRGERLDFTIKYIYINENNYVDINVHFIKI